ncbi:hypothetical protein HYT55_00595 [Candidatus Woesearchaeota archaeon]|nr:hypothetical protein [Candidatus Woesearchaeota archaeon]
MDKIYWGADVTLAGYHRSRFEEFLAGGSEEFARACRDEGGRLKHVVSAEHLDLALLKTIHDTTNAARRISKIEPEFLKGLLRHTSVLNYFPQPSTRTFLSFSRAESKLGIQREEVRDLKTSSTAKGESDLDALRTQSSFYEGMVVRHPSDLYGHFTVWAMQNSRRPLHIFNAGSGTKEHPTQGILDHYTIEESLGSIDGKTIAFYGDCLRSRVIHSGARLLALHKGVTVYFVAPEHLQIDAETEDYIAQRGVTVHKITTGIGELPSFVDVNYMTRLQDEYGTGSQSEKYPTDLVFTEDHLRMMPETSILMHPMPKREEIDPRLDYIDDKRIMLWRAQRNGMWTRAGTIAYIFGVDEQIRDKYASLERKMEKMIRPRR